MSGLRGAQNLRKRQIYSRCHGGEEEAPKSVRWVGKLKHSTEYLHVCMSYMQVHVLCTKLLWKQFFLYYYFITCKKVILKSNVSK